MGTIRAKRVYGSRQACPRGRRRKCAASLKCPADPRSPMPASFKFQATRLHNTDDRDAHLALQRSALAKVHCTSFKAALLGDTSLTESPSLAYAKQLEIPPSKYSFAAWKRALHYLLFFLPERHFTFSLPQTLAPFSSAGRNALWSWFLWYDSVDGHIAHPRLKLCFQARLHCGSSLPRQPHCNILASRRWPACEQAINPKSVP